MVKLYELVSSEELTILSDAGVETYFSIDDEIVLINDKSVLSKWEKDNEKKEIKEPFGFFALKTGDGLQLSNEEIYSEDTMKRLCADYKYCVINGDILDIDVFLETHPTTSIAVCKNKKNNKEVKEIKSAGELLFVYEKDYDDFHAIQIWKDKHEKYYKLVVHHHSDMLPDVIRVMDYWDAEGEIFEMSCWSDDDQITEIYHEYDDEEVEFIL